MTLEEKLQIAEILDDMGVDIIEAGFPIASNGDFEAVSEIARRRKTRSSPVWPAPFTPISTVAAKPSNTPNKGRIHTFVSTSPIHLKFQMNKTEDEVIVDHHRHGDPVPQSDRRCRVVRHGRHPHPDRLPVPLRGSRHQVRRDHDQPAGYGRLRHAGRIQGHVRTDPRAGAGQRQGDLLRALPR